MEPSPWNQMRKNAQGHTRKEESSSDLDARRVALVNVREYEVHERRNLGAV